MQYNVNCCVWYLAGRILAMNGTHWAQALFLADKGNLLVMSGLRSGIYWPQIVRRGRGQRSTIYLLLAQIAGF